MNGRRRYHEIKVLCLILMFASFIYEGIFSESSHLDVESSTVIKEEIAEKNSKKTAKTLEIIGISLYNTSTVLFL